MDAVLANQAAVDKIVARHWKDYAVIDHITGQASVTFSQARDMTPGLVKQLGLPVDLFHDLEDLLIRFDFNGNGSLQKKECVKLFRYVVLQRRSECGGPVENVDIPTASIDERGYTVVEILGEGGQGSAQLAKRRGTEKMYCIKKYDKANHNTGGIDAIAAEFLLMEELEHANVARTYEIFQDGSFYYLVNEPYLGGDLTKLASQAQAKAVSTSEGWWRGIFKQILAGLKYLHGQAIIHCDIKEPNIMIASSDNFKTPRPVLIDFGLAKPFSSASGLCGTPGYIPPETFDSQVWWPCGDVFSLGIVFFQLLSDRVPRDGIQGVLQVDAFCLQDICDMARKVQLPWAEFPGTIPILRQLIEWMTCPEWRNRPRVPQCLDHEWFKCGSDAPLHDVSLPSSSGPHPAETNSSTAPDAQRSRNEFERKSHLVQSVIDAGEPVAHVATSAGAGVSNLDPGKPRQQQQDQQHVHQTKQPAHQSTQHQSANPEPSHPHQEAHQETHQGQRSESQSAPTVQAQPHQPPLDQDHRSTDATHDIPKDGRPPRGAGVGLELEGDDAEPLHGSIRGLSAKDETSGLKVGERHQWPGCALPRVHPRPAQVLRVFCTTWNLYGQKAPADKLSNWIFKEPGHHIYAVGTCECEQSIAKATVFSNKSGWEQQAKEHLNKDYFLLGAHTMGAVHLMVFVHCYIWRYCWDIKSGQVATGLGNVMGNKGGVQVGFKLGRTSLLFINAHLAAHQGKMNDRTRDFTKILLQSPLQSEKHGPSVHEEYDRVFFMGDLNPRLNATREEVDAWLKMGPAGIHKCIDRDQLFPLLNTSASSAKSDDPFFGLWPLFSEGDINFPPTYKFDVGVEGDIYDTSKKRRVPSWTDRIVWKTDEDNIRQLVYTSVPTMRCSDHRPIFSQFEVRVDLDADAWEATKDANDTTRSSTCCLQ